MPSKSTSKSSSSLSLLDNGAFDAFSFDDDDGSAGNTPHDRRRSKRTTSTSGKLLSSLVGENANGARKSAASSKERKNSRKQKQMAKKMTKNTIGTLSTSTSKVSVSTRKRSALSSTRNSSSTLTSKKRSADSLSKNDAQDPYEFTNDTKRKKLNNDDVLKQLLKQKKKNRSSNSSLDDLAHFEDILDYDDELAFDDSDDENGVATPLEKFKPQRRSTGSNSSASPSKKTIQIQNKLNVLSSASHSEEERTNAAHYLLESFFNHEFMVYLRAHDLVGQSLNALRKSSEIHTGELYMVTIQMLCAVLSDAQNLAVVTKSELKSIAAVISFLEKHAHGSNERLVDPEQSLARDILSLALTCLTQVGKLQGGLFREIASTLSIDFSLLHSLLNRLFKLIKANDPQNAEKLLRDAQGVFLLFENRFLQLTEYEHHERLLQEMFEFFTHFSTVDFSAIGSEFSGHVECCVTLLHILTNVSNNNSQICAMVSEMDVVQTIGRIFSSNSMRHYDLVVSILAVLVNLGQSETKNFQQLQHVEGPVSGDNCLPKTLLRLAHFSEHAKNEDDTFAKLTYSTEEILAIEMYSSLLLGSMISKLSEIESMELPPQEVEYIVSKIKQFMQIQIGHGLATEYSVQALKSIIKTLKSR
uniref:Wings apart-like protein C-terminal domain-containing protein n=1 Tax=Percolomonas cosmopolitus TaxID=63605 RepID=A0A7S1PIU0_9EUKA